MWTYWPATALLTWPTPLMHLSPRANRLTMPALPPSDEIFEARSLLIRPSDIRKRRRSWYIRLPLVYGELRRGKCTAQSGRMAPPVRRGHADAATPGRRPVTETERDSR